MNPLLTASSLCLHDQCNVFSHYYFIDLTLHSFPSSFSAIQFLGLLSACTSGFCRHVIPRVNSRNFNCLQLFLILSQIVCHHSSAYSLLAYSQYGNLATEHLGTALHRLYILSCYLQPHGRQMDYAGLHISPPHSCAPRLYNTLVSLCGYIGLSLHLSPHHQHPANFIPSPSSISFDCLTTSVL
jgi:hypothetical protein